MTSNSVAHTDESYIASDMTDVLVDSIVSKLKEIFIELGPKIVSKAGNIDFTKKQDGSPVTDIDGQIEDKIIERLNLTFPRLIVYGEESGYSENLPEVCVLIDPIDGTKSFIKGIPSFTSMAVLIINDNAIASVIYNPSTENMYSAVKNQGAFLNNEKLNLKNTKLPKTAISKKRHMGTLSKIMDIENIDLELSPSGGGYGFCKVAEGSSAARFQINAGGYIHDYAPGALLVSEAGGIIMSLNDDDYTIKSRDFIAFHPELKELIEENIKIIKDYKNELTIL